MEICPDNVQEESRKIVPMIQKLHDEIVQIGNEPAFRQKRLIDIGIVPVFDTPEQFGATIKSDIDKYVRVIKQAGIKPE